MERSKELCLKSEETLPELGEVSYENLTYLPLILIFLSQFIMGIAATLFYALGLSYLDDSTQHKKAPIMHTYALSMRMFGPIIGYVLAYYTTRIYIDPSLTPTITKDHPQWLGS